MAKRLERQAGEKTGKQAGKQAETPAPGGAARWRSASLLLCALLITFGAGVLDAGLSQGAPEVYANLPKPAFAPPAWVFEAARSALCLLGGLALWRVWRRGGPGAGPAALYFLLALSFQVLWSALFFRFGLHFAAFVCLLVLFAYLAVAVVRFFRAERAAGLLLLPLLLWAAFACVLQAAILLLGG